MAVAGAFVKASPSYLSNVRLDWKTWLICLSRWRTIVGSLLGALLLGASAQASLPQISPAPPASRPAIETPSQLVTDGVYLYGQAPQPGQLGVDYMVFEVHDENFIGALFRENSSFDCFQGRLREGELSLEIINSYSRESYSYAIALATGSEPLATTQPPVEPLRLEGFFQLEAIREQDLYMLSTCKADLLSQATQASPPLGKEVVVSSLHKP